MTPSFLFDLDGTLVDNTYLHAVVWHRVLGQAGVEVPAWRVHRAVGMPGDALIDAMLRDSGRSISNGVREKLHEMHAEMFARESRDARPLPGARELLKRLSADGLRWAIATSASKATAAPTLEALGVDGPVVTREAAGQGKPAPDIFAAAAKKLKAKLGESFVVGDSVWDLLAARRGGAMGIGLRTGGTGGDELRAAGAYRVYADPAELLAHLDELGLA